MVINSNLFASDKYEWLNRLFFLSGAFRLVRFASRKIENQYIRKFLIAFLVPFAIIIGGLFAMYGRIRKKYQTESKRKYHLSIVAIAKNEGEYIREWCAYHKVVGIDHIYLYDNGSTDNMREEIDAYVKEGYVTYTYWGGEGKTTA